MRESPTVVSATQVVIAALAVMIPAGGCAVTGTPTQAEPSASPTPSAAVPSPYTGPLYLPPDQLTSAADRESGAAGRAVSCRTRVSGYRDDPGALHPGAGAETAEKALRVGYGEGLFDTTYAVFTLQRREPDRALFTHMVDGVAKQAAIVHHGPTADRGGKVGWYVESRARCDWAELPDDLPGFLGQTQQIWTGSDGRRAPTYDIVSYPGPEHCDWQSMTMLSLAGMPDLTVYVRAPEPELSEWFGEPFRADVSVPAGAADTGYSRDGRHLWRSADQERVYVGSLDHAELWPITTRPLGCA